MTGSPSGRKFRLCLPVIAPVLREYVAKASVREKFPVISTSLLGPHTSLWCGDDMHSVQHLTPTVQRVFHFMAFDFPERGLSFIAF